MCFRNADALGGNKVKIWQNLSKSHILTLPHPQGHVMSGECEQPLYELIVQVWLLYDHPNFKYCTVCKRDGVADRQTDGQTNRQTDGRTDDPNTRCPPADQSGRGHKYMECVTVQLLMDQNNIPAHTNFNINANIYSCFILHNFMERRFNIYSIIWRYLQIFEDILK